MAAVQPIDYEPIYTRVLSDYANSKGILPPELQRLGYGKLDNLVKRRLADRGIERFTADLYETALRSVIREIMANPDQTKPGPPRINRVGADLATRAEQLLTARGVTMKDATADQYAEALATAKEALDLEARNDMLTAVRDRLKSIAAADVADKAYTLLEARVSEADGLKSRRVLARGA